MPKTRKKKIDVPIYFRDLKLYKQKEIRKLIGDTILPSPLWHLPIEYEIERTFTLEEDLEEEINE